MEKPCSCSEGSYVATRTREIVLAPQVHNCAYIRKRNALIPEAERIASQREPERFGHERPTWKILWSLAFFAAMSELASQKGI